VARHVGEELLKNPERRCRALLIQHRRIRRQRDLAPDPGPHLKISRLPSDRRRQTELIQHLGPQSRGDLADRLNVSSIRPSIDFVLWTSAF